MSNTLECQQPAPISTWNEEREIMVDCIKQLSRRDGDLSILEAGCGNSWGLDLDGVNYTLTGVDLDQHALDIRINEAKDLDLGMCGDLRTVSLPDNNYDVIFNAYVLEHVAGAEIVLNNFVRWLKPGGVLILVIPNRDSVWGFVTRMTPFWFHVVFKRYFMGEPNAGKPGYAPYPTVYDKVVSRRGIRKFCAANDLQIRKEYFLDCGVGHTNWLKRQTFFLGSWILHLASFKRLSRKYGDMVYIIDKSPSSPTAN